MNMILIGFVIIAIFLIVTLIYLLSINKNIKKQTTEKKTNYNIGIDIAAINFPKNIENMNYDALFKACKVIYDSYNALGYVNKSPSSIDKVEWHSWQLSMLLFFLQKDNNFFVSENNDKLFQSTILQLNETQIKQELQRIYNKYLENVNIYKNRDELSKDVIWTARDVSILLYKMINK
ncbi:MAG: hypothetical protein KA055_00295 [Aliarcobacter sp.]|nr:hypothetical protein [Aliarcobacter sp.]